MTLTLDLLADANEEITKLRERLMWVMENTEAGDGRPGIVSVNWLDEDCNEQTTYGSSYEDAIDKAMAEDAADRVRLVQDAPIIPANPAPVVEHETPPATPARDPGMNRWLCECGKFCHAERDALQEADARHIPKYAKALAELSRLRSECADLKAMLKRQLSAEDELVAAQADRERLRFECDGLREALTKIRRHAALLTVEVGRERDPRLEAIRYASLEQMVSDEKEFAGVARPLTDEEVNLVLGLRFPPASSSTPGAHP